MACMRGRDQVIAGDTFNVPSTWADVANSIVVRRRQDVCKLGSRTKQSRMLLKLEAPLHDEEMPLVRGRRLSVHVALKTAADTAQLTCIVSANIHAPNSLQHG